MSDITFYVPEKETIPTALRLYVGDTFVTYERIVSGFRFEISTGDEQKALSIANEIVERIIQEHDESEHGVTWRTVSLEIDNSTNTFGLYTVVLWKYRIRDAY